MSILKQARLVDSRKEGRWMFYRLADADAPVEATARLPSLSRLLAGDAQMREDAKRLKQILKIDRDESCAGSRTDAENSVPLHRQLLPQPDGRGLGAPPERRPDRGLLGRDRGPRTEPRRRARSWPRRAWTSPASGRSTVGELRDVEFDYVVTVCDHAHESCPVFPGKAKVVHVGFDDPPRLAADAKTEEERLGPLPPRARRNPGVCRDAAGLARPTLASD